MGNGIVIQPLAKESSGCVWKHFALRKENAISHTIEGQQRLENSDPESERKHTLLRVDNLFSLFLQLSSNCFLVETILNFRKSGADNFQKATSIRIEFREQTPSPAAALYTKKSVSAQTRTIQKRLKLPLRE